MTYSIIIPHFNIPDLLERCIKSVPKRQDTEIIVVDDKSNKESVARLIQLQAKYPYVQFIFSDTNGGGGKARNIGLNAAKGKYIIFADADDFFNLCFDDVLDDYRNESADMVMFGSNSVDTNTYQTSNRANDYVNPINFYDGKNDFNLRYNFAVPWSRFVKKQMIDNNNIRFQETPRHNDVGFSYLVGYYAETLKVDKRAIYCCTTREGSVSTNISLEALKAGLYVYKTKHEFLKAKGIDLGFPYYVSYALYSLRHDDEKFKECLKTIVEMGFDKKKALNAYRKLRIVRKLGDYKRKFISILY